MIVTDMEMAVLWHELSEKYPADDIITKFERIIALAKLDELTPQTHIAIGLLIHAARRFNYIREWVPPTPRVRKSQHKAVSK